ncbi:182 kDa tankyrase-1-binding protein-like isoform X6 [Ahaetulla prasina]|uniref:182 kDa tankyrase-1-binding protein-like isoform X6 n=1 Tax=Ahaetulla prasina TaxID=499056 RepID=UPI0026471769|nr:182 kDa tankyrase-1-binding protein-like isoform X6 [Ahaetulla prasina]
MNMQRERGSPEPPSGLGSRSLGLAFMLTSESPPDVMDSKPQSLCSSFSITAANGRKDTKPPSSSSEIGDARPKPPVKPKPCVLPKPAMPVKPTPGLRQTLSEVPSAEKINLLAGPKPYSSGAGSAVKRLSFNLKCSPREVTNGKEVPSFFSTASKSSEDKEDAEPTKKSSAIERASEEECRESSSVAKCTLPFKVKPVPVATKPERFPGTTVEEILAKIEKPSESSPSSERPRLVRSFFSQDGGSAVHLGPKGYVAFRRSSSGEEGVGTDPEGSVYRVSCEIKERSLSRNKELKEENRRLNEQHAPESQQPETEVKRNEIFLPTDSSSSQPSTSCEGNQLESSSSPSSPGDLLGWSRKDLHSEFGIVGADHSDTFHLDWTADVTRVKWLGETEQDREFGTGSQDWPNSYTVGNTKSQDMEFGTSQQEWARGSPLRGSSSPVQEEWLASYGSHGADHSTEESNWSSTYNISTAEGQHAEPYMRKPGWPSLCHAGSDQQSSEFAAVEKTDWSSQYQDAAAETTDWPKYHMENVSCPESDVSPESAKVPSEYTIESKLETEFCVKHSDDSTPVSVFSASHLGWPSESDSGSSTSQPQREFTAHQVELSSEPQNRPEDQLSFQQDSGPDTYGFDDGSYPESKLSVKLSDSPSRCGTEIAQNQVDEFSAGKSDGAKEYDGEIGCRIEIDGGMKGSNSQMEADNQEFYARRPIWSDEYCLGKFEPQEDTTGRGDWIKDSKFSESEQSDTIGQALIAGLGSLDLSDQKVTVNLEESTDNLIHQAGNLTNLAMDEPRGIGEGEPEWTQHLDTGELAISGDLKVESLEAYKKPAEKHLDWVLPFGMETSSASSNTRSVNAEEGREPDVGQADLINNMDVSDSEKTDVSGLRPKALDGAEVAYRGERRHLGDTVLEDDVMQHQGATPACGESRKCHSQRLSSPSCLLEGLVSSSANRPEVQQKRPASFHSCHSEEERKLNNLPSELVPAAEKIRQSPFPLEDVGEVLSDTDGDISQLDSGNGSQPPERQSESQATQPISQDDCALEGAEALTREKFTFLEDTEVLDNSAHRDRANLGRKRGHRAPITRAGSTGLENDRNSWMFRDSTEPQLVPAGSDEEVHEETKSKKSRSSPLSKGVKVALFPGLSPSALKAKLRGRNRSAEEVEPQGEVKEAPVQRSKSCKMGSTSGKPLVLPPKPDKSSGELKQSRQTTQSHFCQETSENILSMQTKTR